MEMKITMSVALITIREYGSFSFQNVDAKIILTWQRDWRIEERV